MSSYFIFGGIDSRDYGLVVSTTENFSTSLRDYTIINVPGRSGDIYKDNKRYQNTTVTYHCSIDSQKWLGFGDAFEAFRKAMNGITGYQTLEDSYRPDIYRHAILASVIKPSSNGPAWNIGEFDITFSCKPQMWLKDLTMDVKLYPVLSGRINYDGYRVKDTTHRSLTMMEIDPSVNINIRLKKSAACTIDVRQYSSEKAILVRTTCEITEDAPIASISADPYTRYIAMYWDASELADNAVTVVAGGKLLETVTNDGPMVTNSTGYQVYPKISIACISDYSDKLSFYVGDTKVVINKMDSVDEIVIDYENQKITDGNGTSANSLIAMYDGDDYAYDFPVIEQGETVIKTTDCLDDGSQDMDPPATITITGTARTV